MVNGVLAIEAENYASKQSAGAHQWVSQSFNDASGNLAMLATPDNGSLRLDANGAASMSYPVTFPETGIYEVWLRGSGDTNVNGEGKNDSVHIGLNGNLSSAAAIHNFPSGWNWSNERRGGSKATVNVNSVGTHTLSVWMREDGFLLDKIVIQQQGLAAPTGNGLTTANTDTDDSTDDTSTSPADDEIHAQYNGIVAIEAESYDTRTTSGVHSWVSLLDNDASAGNAMVTTPNSGALNKTLDSTPVMKYPVLFTESGLHTIWIRGYGDTNPIGYGNNDSVHVSLDNSASSLVSLNQFPAAWTWSRQKQGGGIATINIPSVGVHTVTIGMREDGFQIDKFIIAKSNTFTPTGVGPASSFAVPDNTDNSGQSEGTKNSSVSDTTNWIEVNSSDGTTPVERHEAGMLAIENKLYLMGGRGNKPVSVYDAENNNWINKAAPPIELHHFQPVNIDGKAYVVGAMTGGYPNEDNVANIYIYDPKSDQWSIGDSIPDDRRRGGAGAVLHNGKIYIVGGNTRGHNGGAVNWLDEYNPATGQWRTLPSAPTTRDHLEVAIVNNKLVVAGGRQSTQPHVFQNTVADVDVFDFDTNSWNAAASIPTPRAGTMTVAVGEEVIVIGGEVHSNNQALTDVQAYNVRNNAWRNLKPLLQGRHSGGAAIIDGAIHVVSGNTSLGGGNETTHHEKLTID